MSLNKSERKLELKFDLEFDLLGKTNQAQTKLELSDFHHTKLEHVLWSLIKLKPSLSETFL